MTGSRAKKTKANQDHLKQSMISIHSLDLLFIIKANLKSVCIELIVACA